MKTLLAACFLVAAPALADVGPRPPSCTVPASCVSCTTSVSEPDAGADCRSGAADAGLSRSDCTDSAGAFVTEHFCPKGVTASRPGCGCSAVDAPSLLALLALVSRRQRSAS
jgi:uncharacterized protein (TIGR03382 family)